jgi:imidazoleglycerol phosphate synthase glutamine amidotransferase subunit HisH
MKTHVTVLDYGCGNLFSVLNAFSRTADVVEVADSYKAEKKRTHLVLPGVGTYGEAVEQVRSNDHGARKSWSAHSRNLCWNADSHHSWL